MWQRPLGKIPAYRLLFRPRFSAVPDTFRGFATMTTTEAATGAEPSKKLHGRAFYESIGSPKFIVAPMVDQSEFVCLARLPQNGGLRLEEVIVG